MNFLSQRCESDGHFYLVFQNIRLKTFLNQDTLNDKI